MFVKFTDLRQHDPVLPDDEAHGVLDVARAKREVCRAEQALAKSLAEQHAAIAKLYEVQAQGLEELMGNLETNVGMIRATMRRHGTDETISRFVVSRAGASHQAQGHSNPDGMSTMSTSTVSLLFPHARNSYEERRESAAIHPLGLKRVQKVSSYYACHMFTITLVFMSRYMSQSLYAHLLLTLLSLSPR